MIGIILKKYVITAGKIPLNLQGGDEEDKNENENENIL